jgi:hypothetical protein
MTNERIFTLEEANRVLPLVRSITRDAVRLYRMVKNEIRALGRRKADRRAGSEVNLDEIRRLDASIAAHLEELRRLIGELESLGCRLRDYERGVVDFPAATMDGDKFLFYCWMRGEAEVAHWHFEEEGFENRRALDTKAHA